jgi:ankyrin repeat protein
MSTFEDKKDKVEKWLEKRKIDKVLKCLEKHQHENYTLLYLAQCIAKKRAGVEKAGRADNDLLDSAKEGNMGNAILALLDGANIEAADRWGSALLRAMFNKNRRVAELLIYMGANVNAKDSMGESILMDAVAGNLPHMVELLIKKGVNPFARNRNMRSAKDIAKANERKMADAKTELIIDMLERYEKYVIGEISKSQRKKELKEMAADGEIQKIEENPPENNVMDYEALEKAFSEMK